MLNYLSYGLQHVMEKRGIIWASMLTVAMAVVMVMVALEAFKIVAREVVVVRGPN